jgi:hypothetical protein
VIVNPAFVFGAGDINFNAGRIIKDIYNRRLPFYPLGGICVVDVEIVRSSGDAAFDRAAETAVRAVGRFSELQGMPPRMFERSFRSLLLTFRPEDLLN